MHIRIFRHAIFGAAALALVPYGSASAQETFKIGAALGLTGYGSLTDGHWRDGLEAAIAAVNAEGGVLGQARTGLRRQQIDAATGRRRLSQDDVGG